MFFKFFHVKKISILNYITLLSLYDNKLMINDNNNYITLLSYKDNKLMINDNNNYIE